MAPAGRGGEATSDSGLEMGGQGSEEETPQRELAGLGEREMKESWELGPGPAAEASDRPIHPGVGTWSLPVCVCVCVCVCVSRPAWLTPGPVSWCAGEGDTFEALLERQLRLHPHQVVYNIIHMLILYGSSVDTASHCRQKPPLKVGGVFQAGHAPSCDEARVCPGTTSSPGSRRIRGQSAAKLRPLPLLRVAHYTEQHLKMCWPVIAEVDRGQLSRPQALLL